MNQPHGHLHRSRSRTDNREGLRSGTPGTPVFSGTLYVFPENVTALANEYRDKVEFAWGPEVMDYGMREFAVQDPNGYFLAFSEPA